MAPLQELLTSDDLEKVWEESTQHPAFIFKLSTTCPVSADAFDQYHTFIEGKENEIAAFFVKVRETRDVSNQIDRKSTRLNSSHVAISYAVFCLKKKR